MVTTIYGRVNALFTDLTSYCFKIPINQVRLALNWQLTFSLQGKKKWKKKSKKNGYLTLTFFISRYNKTSKFWKNATRQRFPSFSDNQSEWEKQVSARQSMNNISPTWS